METIVISGKTHPGKRRKENQDTYTCKPLWSADKALLAVIDGVGGYTGGEEAARIARESIEQYMQIPRGDTLTMLREAVVFANNRVVEERKKDHQHSEMCCVLTAVVADTSTGDIYYAHVGDTRLYRFRNGQLQKLTKDHSFVGLKEDAGEITELEAMQHPQRNQILRELGSAQHRLDDEDFMDYGREDFLPGDLLLLCSDGLTDMVTAQQITTLLSTGQPLATKVDHLIALANDMGGHDNVTVVLLQNNLPVSVAEVPVAIPGATTKPTKEKPVFKQQTVASIVRSAKSRLWWVVLLLVLVAGAGWYLSPNQSLPVALPDIKPDSVQINNSKDSTQRTAVRSTHPAAPGPVIANLTDTLRLSATKNLADLQQYADSTGKTLYLLPAKGNHRSFAAIEITRRSGKAGDTVLIKNLRLNHFETGINVRVPVYVQAENVLFNNIHYPFSYTCKPDSAHQPVLFINTAKQ